MKPDSPRDATPAGALIAEDADLIEEAQRNPQTFGPLYDKYYSRILGYLYRRTLSADLAEELTSNTFFQAIRALPRYEHRGHFAAWLYRIATNEINAHQRSARRRPIQPNAWEADLDRIGFTAAEDSTAEEVREKMLAFAKLHEAVDQLPEKYRTAVSLRYFERMAYAEIAEVLGKREGTVKSLIHRGLKQLKNHYRREPQEDGQLL